MDAHIVTHPLSRWKADNSRKERRAQVCHTHSRARQVLKWEKREELSGKNAQQAVKSAIARYPGYLLYFPKRVLKKALASKQR